MFSRPSTVSIMGVMHMFTRAHTAPKVPAARDPTSGVSTTTSVPTMVVETSSTGRTTKNLYGW